MDQNQDNTAEYRLNEALSALMDGEVDELELRRILRELPQKPELYATWKRYHSLRASLNRDIHANPRVDLLAGVQARLDAEQEAPVIAPQGRVTDLLRSRIVRHLGQGAIAASFAVAALMGVSLLQGPDGAAGSSGAAAPALANATPALNGPRLNGEFNASAQTQTVAFDAEAYNRLQQAVYREFSEAPRAIPVSYNPEFPVELTPTE